MDTLYTLTDFINYELENYGLDENSNNQKKLRAFFTRLIKTDPEFDEKEIWDNAPTIQVEKTTAKQFKLKDLQLIANHPKTLKYMEKLMKKRDPEMHADYEKKVEEHKNNLTAMQKNPKSYEYNAEDQKNIEDSADEYIQKAMLKALFEHFFTPFDKEKVMRDISAMTPGLGTNAPFEFDTSPSAINANYRLDHPSEFYFKEKK